MEVEQDDLAVWEAEVSSAAGVEAVDDSGRSKSGWKGLTYVMRTLSALRFLYFVLFVSIFCCDVDSDICTSSGQTPRLRWKMQLGLTIERGYEHVFMGFSRVAVASIAIVAARR